MHHLRCSDRTAHRFSWPRAGAGVRASYFYVGSGIERIDPLSFLAGRRKRRLNQALSVLSLSLRFLRMRFVQFTKATLISLRYLVFVLSLGCSCYVVSTSASDWLERLISEMAYNVLMGMLNLLTIIISVC